MPIERIPVGGAVAFPTDRHHTISNYDRVDAAITIRIPTPEHLRESRAGGKESV